MNISSEPVFDDLCEIAKKVFNVKFAGIVIVHYNNCRFLCMDNDIHEFNNVNKIPRSTSLCNWTIKKGKTLILPNLSNDNTFKNYPILESGINFYGGTPLRTSDGIGLGTFCILDNESNYNFDIKKQEILEKFGDTIVNFLESQKQKNILKKSKNIFLANVSHELRTPLHGILGLCDIMKETTLNNTQKEYINDLIQQGSLLLNIVNQILTYTKLDSHNIYIKEEIFNVFKIILNCCKNMQIIANKKNIDINLKFLFSKELEAVGDFFKIEQILINLLSNSIKFSEPNNKIIVTISLSHLSFEDNKLDNEEIFYLNISVLDYGIGIKSDMLDEIFKPFTQEDSSDCRKHDGLGLGLSIVSTLVKSMNGIIKIESKKNHGTNFKVILKLKYSEKLSLETININDVILVNKKKEILIVDDNLINLKIVKKMIQSKNVNCISANNGLEALKIINNNKFDIILMDIQMPIMDGIEATKNIRSNNIYKNIPIIALTASVMKKEIEYYKSIGINYVLSKPFKKDQLISIINKFV
jgi:signal transduction histidine kinase